MTREVKKEPSLSSLLPRPALMLQIQYTCRALLKRDIEMELAFSG